jgi:hypothetical protein
VEGLFFLEAEIFEAGGLVIGSFFVVGCNLDLQKQLLGKFPSLLVVQ